MGLCTLFPILTYLTGSYRHTPNGTLFSKGTPKIALITDREIYIGANSERKLINQIILIKVANLWWFCYTTFYTLTLVDRVGPLLSGYFIHWRYPHQSQIKQWVWYNQELHLYCTYLKRVSNNHRTLTPTTWADCMDQWSDYLSIL